jgi:hypothetical protein
MSRAEVEKLGLEVRPHPSGGFGDNVRMVGKYWVVFAHDRVDSIAAPLRDFTGGLAVTVKTIPPGATLEEAAKFFPDCSPLELREGGNVIQCQGGKVMLKQGSETGAPVEVQVFAHPL